MNEIWKDIPGYEGMYQVSNLGKVKSIKFKKEKILSLNIDKDGYYRVNLHNKSISKTSKMHQLVAIAFLNHIPNGNKIVVDHLNNNKLDNRLENIQLITQRENISKDKKNRKSKYTGVIISKRDNSYRAAIRLNGKNIHLGIFISEEEASEYYQNALKAIENNEEIVIKKPIQTSIYKGVSWNKKGLKWQSSITLNGKRKYLGSFGTELEAHEAYQNRLKEIT